jgi:hypothetical protein
VAFRRFPGGLARLLPLCLIAGGFRLASQLESSVTLALFWNKNPYFFGFILASGGYFLKTAETRTPGRLSGTPWPPDVRAGR